MRIAHTIRVLKPAALALLTTATLWAQFNRGSWLRGEIASDDPSFSRAILTVELVREDRRVVDRVPAGVGGGFEFANIPIGDYKLRIVDPGGNVIREESVRLMDNGNFVTVRLPRRQGERPVSGQVSVAQLNHKAPKEARREFGKALEASGKGHWQAAMAHLEKAIAIDPAYMEAYNNLGSAYMHLNQYDQARDQFQKACDLDPNSPQVAANLAITDLNLKLYPEAEKAARAALKLDATSNKARFLLGLALEARGNDDDAIQNLEAAGREIPKGYLAAAEVLARQGNTQRAAADLKKYLAWDKAERREQLQAWLARLEQAARLASVQAPR